MDRRQMIKGAAAASAALALPVAALAAPEVCTITRVNSFCADDFFATHPGFKQTAGMMQHADGRRWGTYIANLEYGENQIQIIELPEKVIVMHSACSDEPFFVAERQ